MTTLVRIAVAALTALFLSSCGFDINLGDFGTGKKGNGNVVTDSREITNEFTTIAASEGLQVYVTQASEFKIEVEADENVIDLIATDIENGKLQIHSEENIGKATKNIFVSLPEITKLKASSGAYLKTESIIKSNRLEVDGSSGANLNLEISASDLEVDASSGANLNLTGAADHAEIDASSGGNINAMELQTKTCSAEASSGGNMKIYVTKELKADASSGGNIAYAGDPSLEHKKSVSGSVHKY